MEYRYVVWDRVSLALAFTVGAVGLYSTGWADVCFRPMADPRQCCSFMSRWLA